MVVDASVALAWVFVDEWTEFTNALLGRLRQSNAIVPVVWPLEITNALLIAERRGRIASRDSDEFLQFFARLPITVDVALEPVPRSILTIGRAHNLSAYDASYLDLAARRGLLLATLDARLRRAASALGVSLV